MLAELLLCGIASMDVGFKTAAKDDAFFKRESISVYETEEVNQIHLQKIENFFPIMTT